VNRLDVPFWQPKSYAVKSYSVDTKKVNTIDENQATGTDQYNYKKQLFTNIYITDKGLVYGTYWPGGISGQQQEILTINDDGSGKKVLADYDSAQIPYLNAITYEPNGIYFGLAASKVVAVEDGALKDAAISVTDFNQGTFYPTYLVSPASKYTFWYEPRDGKKTLLVGDINGKSSKTILNLGDYTAYGWYSDEYVLVSKNNSELYVLPRDGGTPLKISDYHKPNFNGAGYGYGYGGF
jgi:hypothetical protein